MLKFDDGMQIIGDNQHGLGLSDLEHIQDLFQDSEIHYLNHDDPSAYPASLLVINNGLNRWY